MNNIADLTVHDYLAKLAAPTFPGPAVGSAAATTGAMAAALLEMSYDITMKKDEEQKEHLINHKQELKAIRQHCLALATEDMKAYAEVVKTLKLKEEHPNEYETTMKNATDTLIAVVKNCEVILTRIKQVVETCYIKVLGDLVGSAYLAEAAAGAAKEGVEVNLRAITDEVYKKEAANFVRKSYKKSCEAKEQILELCKR